MILNIIFISLISLSLTLPLIITPLILGLWILLISLITANLLTFFATSWFGLILFIIYIGGILVIFSYFTAITPNQKFKISSTIITPTLFIILLSFRNKQTFIHPVTLQPSIYIPQLYSFSYLLSPSQGPLLIFLAALLLLALIFVVKIVNRTRGPLRPFNYVLTYT